MRGSRYLGWVIWEIQSENIWLEGNITGWAESMETLAEVSRKHPQSPYAGPQKSFQQEW